MHRPVPLLHVVCCEEIGDAGELQQQVVLEAEHGRRPDNGGFGEDVPRHLFAIALRVKLESVWVFGRARSILDTLVAKNSEPDSGLALYDET